MRFLPRCVARHQDKRRLEKRDIWWQTRLYEMAIQIYTEAGEDAMAEATARRMDAIGLKRVRTPPPPFFPQCEIPFC